jgi:TRAP-type C4-dicarboxylate transport system substrate-binding protein
MKKVIILACLFAMMLILTPFFDVKAKPVELKAVTFLPSMAFKSKLFKQFCKNVNEEAGGKLSIRFLGGPEVIGVFEQGQAVSKGVVHMTCLPPALLQGMVPEAPTPLLSRITQEEELKRGLDKFLQPFYNKAKLYYLGEIFGTNDPQFMTFTIDKIDRPQQLAGKLIGGTGPLVKPMASALNFSLKTIPLPDSYTALERKLVKGWIAPAGGIVPFGCQEVLKFGIDHPFFADYISIIINLEAWNNLSADLKNILKGTLLKMAPELGRANNEDELKSRQIFRDAGTQFVKFSPADADWYINTIYDSMWKSFLKKIPETGPELRKILSP